VASRSSRSSSASSRSPSRARSRSSRPSSPSGVGSSSASAPASPSSPSSGSSPSTRSARRRPTRTDVSNGPLIVQSDKTLLLEVGHSRADAARRAIAPFAELERSPEHIHTYRLTPLGLWNARAAGHDAESVVDALLTFSRYAVPQSLLVDVAETMGRYGRLTLEVGSEQADGSTHPLVLRSTDRAVLEEVVRHTRIKPLLGARIDELSIAVHPSERGHLKQELLKVGWPAEDLAGYVDGESHPIALDTDSWSLRPYQEHAVEGFWHGGSG